MMRSAITYFERPATARCEKCEIAPTGSSNGLWRENFSKNWQNIARITNVPDLLDKTERSGHGHDCLDRFGTRLFAILFDPVAADCGRASTLNLLHARHVAHDAGAPFLQRVRDALVAELSDNQARLAEVERIVDDVKQAQIAIAGQWRGAGQRNHP